MSAETVRAMGESRNAAPRCKRCGHDAATHSTTRCVYLLLPTAAGIGCDCPGWETP